MTAQNLVVGPRRRAVRHNPRVPTAIAVVGDRDPSYLTHRELNAALALMPAGVEARWVATDGPEASRLDRFDALWVVPGTPYRDERPVFAGIERARTEGVPILGTCGGFQHMVVEFARNVAGIAEATHAETAIRNTRLARSAARPPRRSTPRPPAGKSPPASSRTPCGKTPASRRSCTAGGTGRSTWRRSSSRRWARRRAESCIR